MECCSEWFGNIIFCCLLLPFCNGQDLNRLSLQLERLRSLTAASDSVNSFNVESDLLLESLHEFGSQNSLESFFTNYSGIVSKECLDSVESIVSSSSSLPSLLLKVLPFLDASGKPGAGVLEGNLIWDGAYDECMSYDYTAFCYATEIKLARANQSLFPQWVVGLCVAKHCGSRDMAAVINASKVFQVSESTIYCEDSGSDRKYSTGAVMMIVVTLVFMGFVIAGTVVDVLIQYVPRFLHQGAIIKSAVNDGRDAGEDVEKIPLSPKLTIKRQNGVVRPWDFVTAFSLFNTVPTLLATKQSPNVITCLNGMRVISMFWVILCHTFIWALFPGRVDNPKVIKDVLSRFSFQAVGNGFFSVDSFFFLSGVLVSYLSLREMDKKRGRFPFLHFYIHRYLRLTPVYAFILFFAWSLLTHLGRGPGLAAGALALNNKCYKYWWTNFLYINNFYPWKSADGSCIGWGWYLANDMQFYVFSPLIIIPMYSFFSIALLTVLSLLLCSFIITGSLVGVYNYQANFLSALAYNFTADPNGPQYFDLVYYKPWSRVQPYLVGLLLGYVLFRKVEVSLSRIKNLAIYLSLWALAGAVMFPDLYGLYFTYHDHVPSRFENILYISVGRFAWGVGLAVIVFICHNGYGWFINSFLSMKIWTPLARMTYCAYLVHPVVISVIYGQLQKSIHYTDVTAALFVVGNVVISYGIAGVICVVVEFPLAAVEMLVFKLVGAKGRAKEAS